MKANPNSVAAHYALGALQERLRQRKEAIASFNEVLRLNPRAAAAQVYLSRLTLQEGTADGAVTYAEGALANAPGNPEAQSQPDPGSHRQARDRHAPSKRWPRSSSSFRMSAWCTRSMAPCGCRRTIWPGPGRPTRRRFR